MAKRLSAAAVAAKWKRNAGNAEQAYKDGVGAVTVNPMAKAAEKASVWIEKLKQSFDNGSYVDGLNGADFADWKRKTADVGATRYRQGVADSESKMQNFLTWYLPEAQKISETVAAMPKITDEDSLRRMETAFRMSKELKYKRRR
jgi:hypothetical protein